MKQLRYVFVSLLVGAFVIAGAPAFAAAEKEKAKDEKAMKAEKGKTTIKVLAENDKLRAQEVRFKPGDVNTTVATSSSRVLRVLKGGTLFRTYEDGKTEKIEYKTGDVKILEPSAKYTAKNNGKSEVVLYVVIAK
jgi:quercetin dioxygenase-like cupin family protein